MRTKEKYKIYKPKKFLGQNFLVDDNISKKIVNYLDAKEDDNILEIGPGQGALSKHISGLTHNFIAVEIDENIVKKLREKYNDSMNIIHKDFLKLDIEKELIEYFNKEKKIKIIGNLPYNISSEILFKLYDSKVYIEFAIVMLQKELAQRLTAKPDTKDYGILSVMTQINCSPKILFNIPPTAFFPKPKVNSSIVKLDFNHSGYIIKDTELLKKIVRNSFGKRRKIMSNSLKELFEDMSLEFGKINFDFSRRPENVSVEEFIKLANDVYEYIN